MRATPKASEMHASGRVDGRPSQVPSGALALVTRLVGALDGAQVGYCHWKSNEAIARSASGDNDLDLLVARADATPFAEVLHALGFKAARPSPDRQLPGIVDYYGLDEPTGRVVHVHAHYQLVLGDDMTKNFRLPIEPAYLRSSTRQGLFRRPSPTFEYVVFVLRMVVKHSTWDAQLGRRGRLTASERRELAYLDARLNRDEVDRLVTAHLPFVGRRLFADCALAAAERTGHATRALTARRLLRALRAHRRRSGTADLALRTWRRRWRRVQRRLPGASPRKRPDTGGLVVALVGGDGAGKSSAATMLVGLLSRDFDVRGSHLGKPPWSRLTRLVKRPLRRLRASGASPASAEPAGGVADGLPRPAAAVWHVLTARDRYLEYRRVRRAAARGTIVVCDRFPTAAVRLMDGPRLGDPAGLERRRLAGWLAAREAGYYAHILPPDLLVVLRVAPAVAVARRRDEDADFVRRRATEVFQADWGATGAVVVDAGAPHDEVHAQITTIVWRSL